ncbi:MAG: glycosyltransferase [Bdellovibrionota bacterium]
MSQSFGESEYAMAFLVWCSIIGTFYAYFGYPLVLALLLKVRGPRVRTQEASPPLLPATLIITVRNEARVIREKLLNTLEMRYGGRSLKDAGVQVIVASDASEDETDSVVREFEPSGVELVRLDVRGGKEQAQRHAVSFARGEMIVFTDAKIRLEPDALERFSAYFSDPSVGAVSSVDRVEGAPGSGSGEGMYVRYEMWLRALESDYSTLVGLSGSCFAVRKTVTEHLRTDIPSDFALLLASRKLGMRGVHAPDVVGTYQAVGSEKAEYERKVRTVLRGITTLFASREVMDLSRYGSFSWQIISHKLFRWLVPWFLVVAGIGLVILGPTGGVYGLLELLMILFLAAAGAAYLKPELRENIFCKLPLFFLLVNAGIAVAWWRFLTGQRAVTWNPSDKGR